MKIKVTRPKPFRWVKSHRNLFDVYTELIRPVRFLARNRSPRLVFRGKRRSLRL